MVGWKKGMWTRTGTGRQRTCILSPKWKKSLLLTFGYHYLKISIVGLCVGRRWPEAIHFLWVSALFFSCEWRLGLQTWFWRARTKLQCAGLGSKSRELFAPHSHPCSKHFPTGPSLWSTPELGLHRLPPELPPLHEANPRHMQSGWAYELLINK